MCPSLLTTSNKHLLYSAIRSLLDIYVAGRADTYVFCASPNIIFLGGPSYFFVFFFLRRTAFFLFIINTQPAGKYSFSLISLNFLHLFPRNVNLKKRQMVISNLFYNIQICPALLQVLIYLVCFYFSFFRSTYLYKLVFSA